MKHQDAEHLTLLNTLLNQTETFLTRFDRAEKKMNTWRDEITQQTTYQQEQLHHLKAEIDRVENILSELYNGKFQGTTEETTHHENEYLDRLKHTEQQLLRQIHGHRAELTRITQHAITQINQATTQAVGIVESKLSAHFPTSTSSIMPLPTETVFENVFQSADEQISQKPPISKFHEWRSVTLTLVTTLLTAVIFGMYTNNEYPWEMHQQAISERDAGKALLNAWPSLTQDEKIKILYRAPS